MITLRITELYNNYYNYNAQLFLSSLTAASDDFLVTPVIFSFNPGSPGRTINISVIDDTAVEDPEMLNLLLSSTDPSVIILNNQSTMLILDDNLNDSEFCVVSNTVHAMCLY